MVIKGEAGEIERNPDIECLVQSVRNGELVDETWPALFKQRHVKEESLDLTTFVKVWRGELHHEYGEASVTGTLAIALKLLGQADSQEAAQTLRKAVEDAKENDLVCRRRSTAGTS